MPAFSTAAMKCILKPQFDTYQDTILKYLPVQLTLCILETPKQVLFSEDPDEMLYFAAFIRVYTVCKGKKDLQYKEYNFF